MTDTNVTVDGPSRGGDNERSPLPHFRWRGLMTLNAAVLLLAFGVFLLFSVLSGLPALHTVQATVTITLTQIVPGVLVWRAIRPLHGWWVEDIVVGTGVGAVLAVGVQVFAGFTQMPTLSWLLGPLLAALLIALPGARSRILSVRTRPLPHLWGPLVSAACLLLLVPTRVFFRRVPLAWAEGFRTTYVDMPFHLALAGQLAHRGPTEVPYVVGEPLHYHWFSHAWVAQVSQAGQVPLDSVLLRYMPVFIAVVVVVTIAAVAVRVSGNPWAGPVAAFVAVAVGEPDLLAGVRRAALVNPLSPSLGFSILVSLTLIAVLASRWQHGAGAPTAWLLPPLAIGLVGAKGSAAPVLVGGMMLATAAVVTFRSRNHGPVLKDSAIVGVSVLFGYSLIFQSRTGGLQFDPMGALASAGAGRSILSDGEGGAILVLLAAGTMALSVLARGAGLAGSLVSQRVRRDPLAWLFVGAGLVGMAAVVTLTHPGQSQWYFLRNAAPLVAVGSALGLVALSRDAGSTRWYSLAVGSAAATVLWGMQSLVFAGNADPVIPTLIWRSATWLLVLAAAAIVAAAWTKQREGPAVANAVLAAAVALTVSISLPSIQGIMAVSLPPVPEEAGPDEPHAFSRDQIEAARWLRDHSDPTAIVATNRHCAAANWKNCDSRRFYVSAYTERRIWVEGWAYTTSWARTPMPDRGKAFRPFWDPQRLATNDGFFAEPDATTARELYEAGVRWLYVDKTARYSPDLPEYAKRAFETKWALVLRLTLPKAPAPGG